MNSKLKWFSGIITLFISYLFASAPGKKLLLIDKFIKDEFNNVFFEYSWLIAIILFVTYFGIEVIVHFRNINKTIKKQWNNICHYIYNYIYDCIKNEIGEDFACDIRVTVFKKSYMLFKGVYIKSVSRYQITEPRKRTRVKFDPGEGVAGICFKTQSLVFENNMADYNKNPDKYISRSSEIYNLKGKKIKKLHIKPRTLLAIPLIYFSLGKTWGVLMIDSEKKYVQFNEKLARDIEKIVSHYKVLFVKEINNE